MCCGAQLARQVVYRLLLVLTAFFFSLGNIQAAPFDCWHWRNPRPHALQLYAFAHGNGVWAGVGGRGGVAVTSVDAIQWDYAHVDTTSILLTITHGKGKFVASTPGQLFQSTDGHGWSLLSSNLNISDLRFVNGYFVGLSGSAVWLSSDGTNWNSLGGSFQRLAFANGVFFGIQYVNDFNGYPSSFSFYTTTDLTNWAGPRILGTNGFTQVTYGNGVYIGWNVILTPQLEQSIFRYSTNATNWSDAMIFNQSQVAGCAFLNSQFVAPDIYGYVFISPDGKAWNKIATPELFLVSSMASDEGTIVCGGIDGRLVSSNDGLHWTERSIGSHDSMTGITYGNGELLAVGGPIADTGTKLSHTVILSSINGKDWTKHASPTTNSLTGVAWSGNRYVAVGEQGTILTSTTSSNWAAVQPVTTNDFLGVAVGGGTYVAIGHKIIASSPDAVTWTIITEPPNIASLKSVAYGGGKFVAVGLTSSSEQATILTSSDGSHWQAVLGYPGLYVVGYGNGLFVAAGRRTVLISTNAINWEDVSFLSAGSVLTFSAFAYGNGWYVLAASLPRLFTSSDGRVWTPRPAYQNTTYFGVTGVAFAGNSFFLTGPYGQILESDPLVAPDREVRLAARFFNGPILTLSGPECAQFGIEYADQLTTNTNWRLLTTVTNINDPTTIRLTPGQGSARFYRAFSPLDGL